MLSYLLFVVAAMVNHSDFDRSEYVEKDMSAELRDGGRATGGLIVKMGPVINMHVSDVRVVPGNAVELPAIAPKGSLFEGFSHNRVYAIRYGKH